MYSDKESRLRCEDECEEVYHTFFTYGACVDDIYGRFPRNAQPDCNLRFVGFIFKIEKAKKRSPL
ncbi:unnamed protein product [Gongylonema pulchrum]|uniref:WSC domain-containing protein n=1 Tax=Gongylonema pulchrum TaxID=637853 RepID=A0A183ETA6_9BILA|nr:unnamed protein product [Gongylonema pulchrum]VDN42523.1 unnamed protein product [Gongylonema pulchrum]